MVEYTKGKKIDKKSIYYVDQDIDKVIAEDIQFPDFVIECKREIDNVPGFQQTIKTQIIRNVADNQILLNDWPIIKYKWAEVDVAVANYCRYRNKG